MRHAEGLSLHDLPGYAERLSCAAKSLSTRVLESRGLHIAGMPMELRFSDSATAESYSSTFYDRKNSPRPEEPVIRIDVLETRQLGWPPPATWVDGHCAPPMFHRFLDSHRLCALYPHQPGVWSFFDRSTRYGIQLTASVNDLPVWDSGAPLRAHLDWALADRGSCICHGATLALGIGCLLAGAAGSGKSTTALSGLSAGLQTTGDDLVAIDCTNGGSADQVVTRPIYRTFKQDRASIDRNRLLEPLAARPKNWQGKVQFDPSEFFPGSFVASAEIKAILFPQVAHRRKSIITPMPSSAGFRALMRSHFGQLPGELESGFRFLAKLTQRLPCYEFALSSDQREVGNTIREFIEALN
jgi:hypothetical protein